MMKRLLAMILAGALCVSMAACGGAGSQNEAQNAGNSTAETNVDSDAAENEESEAAGESDAQDSDTITITVHNGNVVEVPKNIERIAVGNILPMPSVLAVFFDSAEKIVGMPKGSMTAAENSLLSELYPEILNAETGYIDGAEINIEELIKLDVDVVIYMQKYRKRWARCSIGKVFSGVWLW